MKSKLVAVEEEFSVFLSVVDDIIALAEEGGDVGLFTDHPLSLSARVCEPAAVRAARYVQ